MELAGAVEDIGLILGNRRRIETGLRFPENRTELDAAVGKPVAEHIQEGGHFHLPVKALNDLYLTLAAVNLLIPLPLRGLARFDERDECRTVKGEFAVECEGVAFLVAPISDQIFFDILFEAFFFNIKVGHVTTLLTYHYPYISSISAFSLPSYFTPIDSKKDSCNFFVIKCVSFSSSNFSINIGSHNTMSLSINPM